MTITIVRPSIIGAALSQPFPGWIEGVNSSTSVFLLGGLKIMKYIPGNKKNIGDIIPVDMVSDYIITVGAFMAGC